MNETLKKAISANLSLVLLSFLCDGDMSGVELSTAILQKLQYGGAPDEHPYPPDGSLYITLKRLKSEGLTTELPPRYKPGKGAPPKIYRITQQGREYVEEKHLEWIELGKLLKWFEP